MTCSLPYDLLSGWAVTVGSIMPMGGQWLLVSMVVMMSMVYQLILFFMKWYMFSEISAMSFMRTMASFMLSMLIYVGGYSLVLVYSWEYIGLMSFLLISFWWRSEAMGSSIAAVMYNRLGDFSILMFCYLTESWVLGLLSIMGKSAIWILSYWLPMAMEGPTPVSSLLHSSTMVVAGVMLSMMLGGSVVLGVVAVILVSFFLPAWFDGKKMIALSTSVHLVVMFLAVSTSFYGLCMMHILTHAFVKATCFVASGVKIGMTGSQELRWWSMENQMMVMIMSFLLLCGVGGSLVYNSKEMIIFQMLMFVVVLVGWKYTKMFFSGVGGMNVGVMKMQYSMSVIFVMSGSSFSGVEIMTLLMMVGSLLPVFNLWTSYVLNK